MNITISYTNPYTNENYVEKENKVYFTKKTLKTILETKIQMKK